MTAKKIKLITLKSGNYEVIVAPEVGGSIARYSYGSNGRKIDIFRPLSNFHEGPDPVLAMGCFPLVPYSNRIRDGKIKAGEYSLSLPKNNPPEPHSCHGTGWKAPWNVIRQISHSITLELPPNEEFPLLYKARQQISLMPDQLEITLSLTNSGPHDFPAGLGLHPYFPNRSGAEIMANLPQEWCLDENSMPIKRENNKDYDLFRTMGQKAQDLKEMSAYSDWDGSAIINWPLSGRKLAITTTPPLAHLLMWAPPEEEFFCVEPASHAIDGFNLALDGFENAGGTILAPEQTLIQKVIFKPTFGSVSNP